MDVNRTPDISLDKTFNNNNNNKDIQIEETNFRVYKRRWFILMLYWLITPALAMQFQLYSVIANLLVKYYDISFTLAEATATIYLIIYIIFMVPTTYISTVIGIRWSVIVALTGSCFGAWLKVWSVDPTRYWVLLLGQAIVATFKLFFTPLTTKIAAVWFSKNEVSKANSIAMMAGLPGSVVSFLLPSFVVEDGTREDIEAGLSKLALVVAIYNSIALLAVIIFFTNAPPTPPSLAHLNAAKQKSNKLSVYLGSLRRISSNRSFIFLLIMYGLTFSMVAPAIINLNRVITTTYPNSTKDVGYISVAISIATSLGMFISGILSDKYRQYKFFLKLFGISTCVLIVMFIETMKIRLYIVYVTGFLMGFALEAYNGVCIELGLEFNYPEAENLTFALIGAVDQMSGFVFTNLRSYMLDSVGEFWANLTIYATMLVGLFFIIGIKFTLRRQNVENKIETIN